MPSTGIVRRRRRCSVLLVMLVATFMVYELASNTRIQEVYFVSVLVKVQSPQQIVQKEYEAVTRVPLTDEGTETEESTPVSSSQAPSVHYYTLTAASSSEVEPNASLSDIESTATVSYSMQSDLQPSDDRKYKMVVGILSANRDPPTVVRMAQELVAQVSEGDYKFLVWISQSGAEEEGVINSLRDLKLEVHVQKGKYPEVEASKVRITFHDTMERMIWRTTHVLDYANLLERTLQYNSKYILILEDDLKPAKDALDKAYQCANRQLPHWQDWGSLTLFSKRYHKAPLTEVLGDASYGACAMVIRKSIIPGFIEFLRSDPYASPVDLRLGQYMELNHFNIYERTPNLFQHISLHSSYQGKDQARRLTERGRSKTFQYDEDNKTLASIPSKPDGYIGCFVDYSGPEKRDLSGLYAYPSLGYRFSKSSPALCKVFCKDYRYYGLQNGKECYCGNEFGLYGWAPESECNKPCQNQSIKMCGGRFRNSVYRNIDF